MTAHILLILTGKTASGKDTVMLKLINRFPNMKRVVTTTSRPPRSDEKEGTDYFFISEADFRKKIAKGDFIEYVEYGGNLYGTQKSQFANNLNENLIWRIDSSRAGQIRQLIKNTFNPDLAEDLLKRVLVIYLTVDDQVVLNRLKSRQLSNKSIEKRMQEDAEFWHKFKANFNYIVENVPGKLEETVDKIVQILSSRP